MYSAILAFILASIGVTIYASRRFREMVAASEVRDEAHQRVHALAYHDPLTGLPNRRALNERLAMLADGPRTSHAALIYIDLDSFKSVNDLHGIVVDTADLEDETPEQIARSIVLRMSQPFEDDGRVHHIGASVGVALFPSDSTEPDGLARAADVALYRAKHEGRGRHRFYETAMDDKTKRAGARTGNARGDQERRLPRPPGPGADHRRA